MTREEERLGAALEFYDKHKSAASNVTLVDSFVYGTKWADAHPNTDTVKRIFEFALNNTNFLIVDNLDSIDWNKLVKQAIEE